MTAEIEPLLMMRPPHRLLILHDAEGGLGAEEDARDVGIDDGLPLRVGEVFDVDVRRVDAGIVEQHVETAEAVLDLAEQGGDRGLVGDVGGNRDRVAAGFRDDFVERFDAAAGDDERIAGFCQCEGDGAADAGAGAGDECDLASVGHKRSFQKSFVIVRESRHRPAACDP
jgi:hypothetical protein